MYKKAEQENHFGLGSIHAIAAAAISLFLGIFTGKTLAFGFLFGMTAFFINFILIKFFSKIFTENIIRDNNNYKNNFFIYNFIFFIKWFLLILAFYVGIVSLRLNPLGLFCGALLSLVLCIFVEARGFILQRKAITLPVAEK